MPLTDIITHKFSAVLLFSCVALASGCNSTSGGGTPTNPFASNLQTVPPPATFSGQELFLGQVPGSFAPQVPATTFPTSGTTPATQPETPPPSNVSFAGTENAGAQNNADGASVFMITPSESGWAPVEINATSKTAFEATDARMRADSSPFGGTMPVGAMPTNSAESLVVGTSHIVTTITDSTQSVASLPESQSLFSGGFTE